jgi:hypothetical protein
MTPAGAFFPRITLLLGEGWHMFNFTYEDDIKLKINMLREYLGLFIYR